MIIIINNIIWTNFGRCMLLLYKKASSMNNKNGKSMMNVHEETIDFFIIEENGIMYIIYMLMHAR